MFQDAMQNAVDGVWANTIGRVIGWLPDWLVWLFSQPMAVWVALWIGVAAGYVLGRWGWLALAALGGLLIAVFTLGRRSKSVPPIEPEHPPVPRPRPGQSKTLLERILGKRGG